MKQLIDILEKQRIASGISQKDLASAAGLTQAYYSQVVDGKKAGLTLEAFVLMVEKLGFKIGVTL